MPSNATNLTPPEAAEAALAVYRIRLSDDVNTAFKNTQIGKKFALGDGSRFEGTSGIFRSNSGFGVIGAGVGDRQGQAVIVTRGTKTAADWFNNLMAVSTLSAGNNAVHKGFNLIFESFKNDLEIKLRQLNPSSVHCIGHSLGGALANLIAEWVHHKGMSQAHVYTFGSPRVGKNGFARDITTRLRADHINRAYHKTDMVPMIPVWPFVHSPDPGHSCFLHSPGDYPGPKYHDMIEYIDSVNDADDWTKLRKAAPKTNFEKQVEAWLDSDSPLALTGSTISMINSAILYVIKKLALMGIQFAIGMVTNVADLLARFLAYAANAAKEAGKLVMSLLKRILKAIGMAAVEIKNMTHSFIKWVLDSLSTAMNQVAAMAVRIYHKNL